MRAAKLDANRTSTIVNLSNNRATLNCNTQTMTGAERENLFRLISTLGKPTETSLGILPPQPLSLNYYFSMTYLGVTSRIWNTFSDHASVPF